MGLGSSPEGCEKRVIGLNGCVLNRWYQVYETRLHITFLLACILTSFCLINHLSIV